MEDAKLSRRWFFGGAAGLAAAISFVPLGSNRRAQIPGYGVPGNRRVSVVKHDAGEYLYGSCNADSKKITIHLDGVEQKMAITADEARGFVTRVIVSPGGGLCVNYATNEILEETVYGRVVIDIA